MVYVGEAKVPPAAAKSLGFIVEVDVRYDEGIHEAMRFPLLPKVPALFLSR